MLGLRNAAKDISAWLARGRRTLGCTALEAVVDVAACLCAPDFRRRKARLECSQSKTRAETESEAFLEIQGHRNTRGVVIVELQKPRRIP